MFPPRDTFAHTMRPLCTVGDLSVPAGGLAFITIVMVITTAHSAKGPKPYQHSEPGSSPLAEPPSAAATARSDPLPSNPSGSHALLASAACRGTGAKCCCRAWAGRIPPRRCRQGFPSHLLPRQLPTGVLWVRTLALLVPLPCQGTPRSQPHMVWAYGHPRWGEPWEGWLQSKPL